MSGVWARRGTGRGAASTTHKFRIGRSRDHDYDIRLSSHDLILHELT
jgi:hypothetical protein